MGKEIPAAIDELVSSLCDQVERAEEKAHSRGAELRDIRARLAETEKREAALVEALRPFARIGATIGPGWDDNRRAASLSIDPLRVGDLRKAKALVDLANARKQLAAERAQKDV